jgi:RNA polymerase primary sigma factor
VQERNLLAASEAGDEAACEALVQAFQPAILRLARAFHTGRAVTHEDLVQEGFAGLLLAAARYDAGTGTPFWAYASFWVRKSMQELVADLTGPVALSDRAVRSLAAIRVAHAELLQEHGTEPTAHQLGEATGFSRAQVERLLAAHQTPRSLEQQLGEDGAGAAETVGDRLVDPAAEEAYDRVLDELEIREVRSLADQLGDRERTVIRAHYGLDQPAQTLSQIGRVLGLTAERVRQIEVAALDRLRAALAHTRVEAGAA